MHAPARGNRHQNQERLESALDVLQRENVRATTSRRAVLKVLISDHGPFKIEEIHQRIKKKDCDVVTVYRSLATLEKLGLVQRCDFGDGTYRYEFNDSKHHHHHIVCKECREVEEFDLCLSKDLEALAKKRGYIGISHALEIFGICGRCQESEPKNHPQARK